MSIQFQSLFTVQLLHDYYDRHNIKCPDFSIVPAADCDVLMKNMQVLYKNYGNKLLTVVNASKEVNDTPPPGFKYAPFISFNTVTVFRYYIKLNNAHFSNYTSVALDHAAKKCFYFSNLSKNKEGSVLSLSNPVSVHALSKVYVPGNLVKGPDNNFYEALRTSDGTAASKDLTDTNYWQKTVANNPYVNNADEVVLCGSSFTYTLNAPAANIITKIFSVDKTDSSLPYNNLIETIEQAFTQNQQTVSIDVSMLKPGKYKIVINSEEDNWVYVDAEACKQNVYGIIELHQFEKVPADFQILTAAAHIKIPEPVFTIWFKNRSVTWKYISQNGNIGVTDAGAMPQLFEPASAALVKSKQAIALTETPLATLTATKTPGGKQLKNLKNPEVEKLVFEQDGATGFYAANMYIKIDT